MIGAQKKVFRKSALFWFIAAIHVFLVHSFFEKSRKDLFFMVIFDKVTTIRSRTPRHVVLQIEISIHQTFYLSDKKNCKKFKRSFYLPNE